MNQERIASLSTATSFARADWMSPAAAAWTAASKWRKPSMSERSGGSGSHSLHFVGSLPSTTHLLPFRLHTMGRGYRSVSAGAKPTARSNNETDLGATGTVEVPPARAPVTATSPSRTGRPQSARQVRSYAVAFSARVAVRRKRTGRTGVGAPGAGGTHARPATHRTGNGYCA